MKKKAQKKAFQVAYFKGGKHKSIATCHRNAKIYNLYLFSRVGNERRWTSAILPAGARGRCRWIRRSTHVHLADSNCPQNWRRQSTVRNISSRPYQRTLRNCDDAWGCCGVNGNDDASQKQLPTFGNPLGSSIRVDRAIQARNGRIWSNLIKIFFFDERPEWLIYPLRFSNSDKFLL